MELSIIIIISVILFLIVIIKNLFSDTSTRIGRRGEEYINSIIQNKLPNKKYRLLYNVTLQVGNSTTQIDHIIISVRGVFVIETKTWTGWILGTPQKNEWKQIIYQNTYYHSNPIKQNNYHIKVLQKLLKIPFKHIHSIIVFSGDCELKSYRIDNVLYASELIDYILLFEKIIMKPLKAKSLIDRIETTRLPDNKDTDNLHRRNVA